MLKREKIPKETGIAVVPANYEVTSLWVRSDIDKPALGNARVTLLSSSGPIGEPAEIQIDLRQHKRFRTRQRFGGLPIREAGQYLFVVEYRDDGQADWFEVISIPLEIVIEQSPERQG